MNKRDLRQAILKDFEEINMKVQERVTRKIYRRLGKFSDRQIVKAFGSFSDLVLHFYKKVIPSNNIPDKLWNILLSQAVDLCLFKNKTHSKLSSKEFLNHSQIDKKYKNQLDIKWKLFQSDLKQVFELRSQEISDLIKSELYKLSRGDAYRLGLVQQSNTLESIDVKESSLKILKISYDKIFKSVKRELENLYNSKAKEENIIDNLTDFVVVSDAHGTMIDTKFMKSIKYFLDQPSRKHFRIIHLGHFFDEDGYISKYLEDNKELLNKFIIIYRDDEYEQLLQLKEKYPAIILLSEYRCNHLVIKNQNLIDDYQTSPIKFVAKYAPKSTIINSHRHQLTSLNVVNDFHILASPGCLCVPHVSYFIRKQRKRTTFTLQSITYKHHHKIYKKRKEIAEKTWQKGLIVLHKSIDANSFHIQHCRYKDNVNAFVYSGKAYTHTGVHDISSSHVCTGDWHSPSVDKRAFEITKDFCNWKKIDSIILNGDIADNLPISHHALDKGNMKALQGKKLGEDCKITEGYIREAITWAKDAIYIMGNHERFISDFTDRYPMLADIIDQEKLLNLHEMDIKVVNIYDFFSVGNAKIVHGDIIQKLYGAYGIGFTKIRSVYGKDVMMGHGHYPMIYDDVYMAGLLGNLKQEYIGDVPTSWLQGIGYIEVYKGESFLSLLNIIDTKDGSKELYYDNHKFIKS